MRDSLIHSFKEYTDIITAIENNDGHITDDLNHALVSVESRLANKVDSYESVLRRLDMEAQFWKSKKDEAARVQHTCEHAAEFLRDRLKQVVEEMGGEIQGNSVSAKLVKNPPKLILNEAELDRHYIKTTVTYSPDKDLIKSDIKEGKEVRGAELIQGTRLKFVPQKGMLE